MGRPLLAFLLVALLASGAAAAAEPASLELGRLGEARLGGELDLAAPRAILDVSGPIAAGVAWDLTWREARIRTITEREADVGASSQLGLPPAREERPRIVPAGQLEGLRCTRVPCDAIVFVEGRGLLGARGSVAAALAPAGEERVYFAGAPDLDGFARAIDAEWIAVGDAPDATAIAGELHGAGDLLLFFDGVTGDVVTARGREPFWTGNRTEDGALGLPAGRSFVRQWMVAELVDARVMVAADHGAFLAFPEADAAFTGELRALVEEGRVVHGERASVATGQQLLAEGTFRGPVRGIAPTDALVAGAPPALSLSWSGDATHVSIGAAQLVHAPGYARQALWASLFLLFASGALFASYSRFGRADLLADPKRRALYSALAPGRAHPLPRLSEALGMTAAAVSYHLRRLEAAGLVRTAREGRTRVAYVGAPPASPRAALALASPTRRAIAEAVARRPGATQADLTRELGLSQRLVAYHLAWLRQAGLVAVEEGRPARYALEQDAVAMLAA